MDVRRTLLHVGVLVGTPALSGALFGAPLTLDHGLRDHGLDLVFGGALIGAPAFSRTLVGDPTLLDDGPACGRALFRRLVGRHGIPDRGWYCRSWDG